MKKLFITLLMGMFLFPMMADAKHYKEKRWVTNPNLPIKAPAHYWIAFDLDEETGDIAISPNYDISGLQISIMSNGITYAATTISLPAGQVYADCLDYLDEGTYTLTLSTEDGIIAQYEITVED